VIYPAAPAFINPSIMLSWPSVEITTTGISLKRSSCLIVLINSGGLTSSSIWEKLKKEHKKNNAKFNK